MKITVTTFLLGALAGAAIALGVRAAILSHDEGGPSVHGSHSAHEKPAPDPNTARDLLPKGLLLDLGNEKCPIMGNEVNGRTYSEWNGLRIGHCCTPCIENLLAAPEKALDEAGIEWRDAARLVSELETATGGDRTALLAEARDKYGIVRMPEGEE